MMILVDTSVWVDHLRKSEPLLVTALEQGRVTIHPFIEGEIACGNFKSRKQVLSALAHLPRITVATDDEVLLFIEHHKLMGKGIGYVDICLLAACKLEGDARLWTRDKRLASMAKSLKLLSKEI